MKKINNLYFVTGAIVLVILFFSGSNVYSQYSGEMVNKSISTIPDSVPVTILPAPQTENFVTGNSPDINFKPKPVISVLKSDKIFGKIDIITEVQGAKKVELNYLRSDSITPIYMGLANKSNTDPSQWVYSWDSSFIPNGEYGIFVNIENDFGQYKSGLTKVFVKNTKTVDLTKEQAGIVDKIMGVDSGLTNEEEEIIQQEKNIKNDISNLVSRYSENIKEELRLILPKNTKNTTDPQVAGLIEEQINQKERLANEIIKGTISSEFKNFEESVKTPKNQGRSDKVIQVSQESFKTIDDTAKESLGIEIKNNPVKEEIIGEFKNKTKELEKVVAKKEEIINNRVGLNVFRDTDGDGISDYDEVNIYHTDPFLPDTDNDGFNDGAEVSGGFNPLNPKAEALIILQDPRSGGEVKENSLAVSNVETLEVDSSDKSKGATKKLNFSGKSLPNSFVTIYIFSNPIVVVIKTDNNGDWSYTLDKEIDDGRHEVYAAVTDNTGNIVAKSAPLFFIKEAQAVTVTDLATFSSFGEKPSFFSGTNFFSSLVFVLLTGLLVLIGLNFFRPKENQTK